jgi:spore germination protein YaaH
MNLNGAGSGWKAVQDHADQLDEVSFFSWVIDPETGDLAPPIKGMDLPVVDAQVDWLHSRDISPMFTVTLFTKVHETLNNPAVLARVTQQIVETARLHNFDGVDIDFEEFKAGDPGDPARYTAFLDTLAKAMHTELTPSGYPKTAIATVLSRTQRGKFRFTDEDAIAKSDIDRIRVMAYDDYYPGSKTAGAGAPLPWVLDVVKFIDSVDDPNRKFVLGIPGYAYRWPVAGESDTVALAKGKSVTHPQAISLMNQYKVKRVWDANSSTPMFVYFEQVIPDVPPPPPNATSYVGAPVAIQTWRAYYEDAESWRAKIDQAVLPSHVAGIAEWALGYEDPASWPMLRERLATPYPIYGAIGLCYARYGGGAFFGKPLGPAEPTGDVSDTAPYGRAAISQRFEHGTISYTWGQWRAEISGR